MFFDKKIEQQKEREKIKEKKTATKNHFSKFAGQK